MFRWFVLTALTVVAFTGYALLFSTCSWGGEINPSQKASSLDAPAAVKGGPTPTQRADATQKAPQAADTKGGPSAAQTADEALGMALAPIERLRTYNDRFRVRDYPVERSLRLQVLRNEGQRDFPSRRRFGWRRRALLDLEIQRRRW